METTFILKWLVLLRLTLCLGVLAQDNAGTNIREFLLECYSDPSLYNRNNRLPMTMTNFIELIRKFELKKEPAMDIKMLTHTLLHRFRMDGIERSPKVVQSSGVTPFSPTGVQYPKHQILIGELISGNDVIFPNVTLTAKEKCALHFMLSSSVDMWERGDEDIVCPHDFNTAHHQLAIPASVNPLSTQRYEADTSRCPIEDGIVRTSHWGQVSPGQVLAGIATKLQVQSVEMSKLARPSNEALRTEAFQRLSTSKVVTNYWAATLAGLIIGSQINYWTGLMQRLRLSQILEMYYSEHGVNFDQNIKACNRKENFPNLVDSSSLLTETTNFAQVLSFVTKSVFISDTKLREYSEDAIKAYEAYLPSVWNKISCATTQSPRPRVHLSVIVDGTWTQQEGIRLITYLAEQMDVSYYGSSINLVNGRDGSWILNTTQNVTEIFEQNLLTSSNITWPTGLYLPLSLQAVKVHIGDKAVEEESKSSIGGVSDVVLILAYSSTISNDDMSRAKVVLQDFKTQSPSENKPSFFRAWKVAIVPPLNWPVEEQLLPETRPRQLDLELTDLIPEGPNTVSPHNSQLDLELTDLIPEGPNTVSPHNSQLNLHLKDVKMIYVTSFLNSGMFKELLNLDQQNVDISINVASSDSATVVSSVVDVLSQVPSYVMGAPCSNKGDQPEFEDYVTPGIISSYRIHPAFLDNVQTSTFEFQSNDYGQLSVCLSCNADNTTSFNCTSVQGNDVAELSVTKPCLHTNGENGPLFIVVNITKTLTKCSGPDVVHIGHRRKEGTACLGSTRTNSCSGSMLAALGQPFSSIVWPGLLHEVPPEAELVLLDGGANSSRYRAPSGTRPLGRGCWVSNCSLAQHGMFVLFLLARVTIRSRSPLYL
uniref:Uncharacterized protein n=1 Tax=Timema douglasi TaxID=61478 RepID=A0A7R8VK92_TIMDO|nr:unnamed protein product [Timema douglasi]